jgi:hypothetical protein
MTVGDRIPTRQKSVMPHPDIEAYIDELEKKYKISPFSDQSCVLYHYTDIEGLKGILESGKMWTTDYRYLNDTQELKYGYEIIRKAFYSLIDEFKKDDTRMHTLLNLLHTIYEEFQYTKLFRYIFIASFCEDGDLLSQWRAYSGKQPGYSIGFWLPRSLMLTKCRYDVEDLLSEYKRLITVFTTDTLKCIDTTQDKQDNELERIFLGFKYLTLNYSANSSLQLKHPGFREEKEWRLFKLAPKKNNPGAVRFRITPIGLVPYDEIDFRKDDRSNCISEVVIGPTQEPSLSSDSISQLLRQNGYENVRVRVSEIPFRG